MKGFDITGTALYKMLKEGRPLHVAKGQVFQTTDHREALTLVDRGYVKRYSITNEGNQSIQIIHGPGGLLSLTLAFRVLFDQSIYDGPEVFYYETITDAKLYTVEKEILVARFQENPGMYADLLQVCGTRLYYLVHSMENMSTHQAYNRIAHQLVFYCRKFGTKVPAGTKIMVPLTQQTIASNLNITRETVALNIKTLRDKKLIKVDRQLIVVPDVERLEEEAHA